MPYTLGPLHTTVILGGNTFHDTEPIIVADGIELFRLRDMSNGQLVADFEVRDTNGQLLVKVARNNVVAAAPGFTARHGPRFSEIVDNNNVMFVRAEELSPRTIQLTGTFRLANPVIIATATQLRIGGLTFEQSSFTGGKGILIRGPNLNIS